LLAELDNVKEGVHPSRSHGVVKYLYNLIFCDAVVDTLTHCPDRFHGASIHGTQDANLALSFDLQNSQMWVSV
jgi:hypothetical protein